LVIPNVWHSWSVWNITLQDPLLSSSEKFDVNTRISFWAYTLEQYKSLNRHIATCSMWCTLQHIVLKQESFKFELKNQKLARETRKHYQPTYHTLHNVYCKCIFQELQLTVVFWGVWYLIKVIWVLRSILLEE
jgi:hypothetical protein